MGVRPRWERHGNLVFFWKKRADALDSTDFFCYAELDKEELFTNTCTGGVFSHLLKTCGLTTARKFAILKRSGYRCICALVVLIAMTVTTYKWKIERYHQAIDAGLFDDQPVELLRGDIVVMPPEREPHAYYNSEVGDYLRTLLGNLTKIRS